jgi:hypothetical protein
MEIRCFPHATEVPRDATRPIPPQAREPELEQIFVHYLLSEKAFAGE